MIPENNATRTEEFLRLTKLIERGQAKFEFNKFFLRPSFSLWIIYSDNQPLIWAYTVLHLVATEWVSIPASIVIAFLFHAWWVVILGVAFSWTIDGLIKRITPNILRRTLMRDENFLNHLWARTPFHMIIVSTQKMKPSIISPENGAPITVVPPHPWQEFTPAFEQC
jgi:hypothetical protein